MYTKDITLCLRLNLRQNGLMLENALIESTALKRIREENIYDRFNRCR